MTERTDEVRKKHQVLKKEKMTEKRRTFTEHISSRPWNLSSTRLKIPIVSSLPVRHAHLVAGRPAMGSLRC